MMPISAQQAAHTQEMPMVDMQRMRRIISWVVLAMGLLVMPGHVDAETVIKRIPTQYIAALGEPGATSGTAAESWGLWRLDPGPRGVELSGYETLAKEGVAPAAWRFDGSDWWLEEHGLIMEQ